MKRALVIRNIVDLNTEPCFMAERKSQLLFGERVTVHGERKEYTEIEQPDGYTGWAPNRALCAVSHADWKKLDEAFTLRVGSPVAEVFSEEEAPVPPYFLSYGSVVYPAPDTEKNNGSGNVDPPEKIQIASPDSLRRWMKAEDLRQPLADGPDPETFGESIVFAALQFLGVPYLWGGRSALGLDCSGLTQLVCSLNGVEIARDSCQQRTSGVEVAREEIRTGDLIFSEGHVVIYMGEGQFIHASQSEGGVTVSSYLPKEPNYRKDLDKGFQQARRLV